MGNYFCFCTAVGLPPKYKRSAFQLEGITHVHDNVEGAPDPDAQGFSGVFEVLEAA